MRYLARVFALVASALLIGPTLGQEISSEPLDGVYRAEHCTEAPNRFCLFFQELRGDGARVLFEGMQSEAKPDECTGGEVKIDANSLRCFKLSDGGYLCDFGYDFGEKNFVFGDVSC